MSPREPPDRVTLAGGYPRAFRNLALAVVLQLRKLVSPCALSITRVLRSRPRQQTRALILVILFVYLVTIGLCT